MSFFFEIGEQGYGLSSFVSALFANPAASGFAADLLISSPVFWIAMFWRRRLGNAPAPWPFILLNLAIGLSCALPAYLFTCERRRKDAGNAL